MHYSFTEKKRIRKSFAKRDNVHQVPFLLATQLESYEKFLQADVPPLKRKNEGLHPHLHRYFRLCRIMASQDWSLFPIPWVILHLMSRNVSSAD